MPPSNIAGVVSAHPLVGRIEEKVRKYRILAEETGLPLIVAAGAHRFTGLDVRQLDDLLKGVHTLTVQLRFGDSFVHQPIALQPGKPPRWSMPAELAGVLWVDNNFPFSGQWRPNPDAAMRAPAELTSF
ncbi:hypothetical protein ACFWB2_06785 [Streptomyces virginiae]|uniref:hypothetical protein n=1 Tax=Streptomyces virginiae TaxID=1961 RepID=UPI003647E661